MAVFDLCHFALLKQGCANSVVGLELDEYFVGRATGGQVALPPDSRSRGAGRRRVRDKKSTPKNLCGKDLAELSSELSGAICLKTLVLPGSALELFRKFFVGFGVLFWPLKGQGQRPERGSETFSGL